MTLWMPSLESYALPLRHGFMEYCLHRIYIASAGDDATSPPKLEVEVKTVAITTVVLLATFDDH